MAPGKYSTTCRLDLELRDRYLPFFGQRDGINPWAVLSSQAPKSNRYPTFPARLGRRIMVRITPTSIGTVSGPRTDLKLLPLFDFRESSIKRGSPLARMDFS